MSCDPAQLIADAECIRTCIPAGALPAVTVSLLCQLAGGGSGTGPYVLKTGDNMSGRLTFDNNGSLFVQVPFVWARFADANNNTEPALMEIYHEVNTGVGGGAANCGVSMDFRTDSATADRQLQCRLTTLWTDPAQATLTSQLRINVLVNAVNTEALRISTAQVDARNGTVFAVAGTQVVGPRNTGWVTFTGTANKNAGALDTGTVTTAQLAQVVKSILDALITHGLLGA